MDLSRHLPSDDEEEEKAETTTIGLSIRNGVPPPPPPTPSLPYTGVNPIEYDPDTKLEEMLTEEFHIADGLEVPTERDDDTDSLKSIKVVYVKPLDKV